MWNSPQFKSIRFSFIFFSRHVYNAIKTNSKLVASFNIEFMKYCWIFIFETQAHDAWFSHFFRVLSLLEYGVAFKWMKFAAENGYSRSKTVLLSLCK